MFVTKLRYYSLVLGIPWLWNHDVMLQFDSDSVLFDSLRQQEGCIENEKKDKVEMVHPRPQISLTGEAAMCRRTKNKKRYGDEKYRQMFLYEINKTLNSEKVTDPEKPLPKEYHDFLPLLDEINTNKLPPHRLYDHKIQ